MSHAIEIAKMNEKIGELTKERSYYKSRSEKAIRVIHECNGRMEDALEKLRPYALNCQENLLAWHKHYNGLLQKERDDNLTLRLQMDDKMAGIRRMNEHFRNWQREGLDIRLPYITKIAELKSHIRTCRRLMGWSIDPYYDDSDAGDSEPLAAGVGDELSALNLGGSAPTEENESGSAAP